jgi:hypothetical protein
MPEQAYNCSMVPVLQGPPPRVTWTLVEGLQQRRAPESAAPCLITQMYVLVCLSPPAWRGLKDPHHNGAHREGFIMAGEAEAV